MQQVQYWTHNTSATVRDGRINFQEQRMHDGMTRIEKGGLVNSREYHGERFWQHLAECRYSKGNPTLVKLPIEVFVRLALCLKHSEWTAIEEDSAACTAAINGITKATTKLLGWTKIWEGVNKRNWTWGAMFLLDITRYFWKDNSDDLVGMMLPGSARGPLHPGTLQAESNTLLHTTSAISDPHLPSHTPLVANEASSTNLLPDLNFMSVDSKEPPTLSQSNSTALYQMPSAINPDPSYTLATNDTPSTDLLPNLNPMSMESKESTTFMQSAPSRTSSTDNRLGDNLTLTKDLAIWIRSQLSEYMKSRPQLTPEDVLTLYNRMAKTESEYLMDLYLMLLRKKGLDVRNMRGVIETACYTIENTECFQLEQSLGLSTTASLAIRFPVQGDCTLEMKIPRSTAIEMTSQFEHITVHFPPESCGTSFT